MPMLHDQEYRSQIERRVRALSPDVRPRWGKMSVDQMLWHVDEALEVALGTRVVPPHKAPLPGPIMKLLVLNLPWPKGAPTLPSFVPRGDYDFAAERDRCLRLLTEFGSRRLEGSWADSPVFGRATGREISRMHAKHLNHHLTQFGV